MDIVKKLKGNPNSKFEYKIDFMMNPNSKIASILFILLMAGLSCEKEDTTINLQANSWKVERIRKMDYPNYEYTDSTYILRFVNDTDYEIRLDVNMNHGDYEILEKGRIRLESHGSTAVCCDSQFAVDLERLFPKMTEFYGIKGELHFAGEGEVVVKPVE